GIHAIIHEAQRLQSNNETLPSLALQRACHSTLKHLEHALRQSSHVVDKSILEAYFDLHFFHRLISANLESIQLLPDPSNSNPSNSDQTTARQKNNDHIALCCVDPSPLLHPLWQRLGGVVLYSGTLQPVSYYQRLLGLSDGKTASFLRSFAEQVHTEVIPLDLRYRQRTQHIPAIMTAIMRMCTLKPGNHFIFFSSYAFMQQVHQQFVAQHPSIETHIQTHRMSLTERMRFLDKFQPEPSGNRVGFVVMGGVFGEGVDLPGDRLKGVMLVSIALPTPDARAQAIEQYFTDQEGSGFAYAYLYPSLCRTLQASGRLIRTDEDEGVLMLVDRRFAQATFTDAFAAYQPILPSHEENDYTEDGCYL
ncbi:MAG: helicase C-terminal domain-containing protein, partial [Gammaproteobacteria bacterium]